MGNPAVCKDIWTEQPLYSKTEEKENKGKEKEEEHSFFFRENCHRCGVILVIQCRIISTVTVLESEFNLDYL